MKLYLNGVIVGEQTLAGDWSELPDGENYLGRSQWRENDDFRGQLDDVRLWGVVRTEPQIREGMHQKLTGNEPHLVALWNFDAGDARDVSPNRHHAQLMGNANCVEAELPMASELEHPSTARQKF